MDHVYHASTLVLTRRTSFGVCVSAFVTSVLTLLVTASASIFTLKSHDDKHRVTRTLGFTYMPTLTFRFLNKHSRSLTREKHLRCTSYIVFVLRSCCQEPLPNLPKKHHLLTSGTPLLLLLSSSLLHSVPIRPGKTYVHVPDWKIPLTKKGFGDGKRAGERIKEYIGDKPLFIYTSPYLRTKQVSVCAMLWDGGYEVCSVR